MPDHVMRHPWSTPGHPLKAHKQLPTMSGGESGGLQLTFLFPSVKFVLTAPPIDCSAIPTGRDSGGFIHHFRGCAKG